MWDTGRHRGRVGPEGGERWASGFQGLGMHLIENAVGVVKNHGLEREQQRGSGNGAIEPTEDREATVQVRDEKSLNPQGPEDEEKMKAIEEEEMWA